MFFSKVNFKTKKEIAFLKKNKKKQINRLVNPLFILSKEELPFLRIFSDFFIFDFHKSSNKYCV